MASDPFIARAAACCALAALLAACAAPAAAPPPEPAAEPMRVMVLPVAPAPVPVPAESTAPAVPNAVHPLEATVAFAERARNLAPAELAQEVQRLGDTSYTPLRGTQLALALAQTRTAASTTRAQSLLQRVLADGSPDARSLHGFARLLSAQLTEQRRVDEQLERQAQQLRDAQRRIEQLNDRLEAVRAIERSLPGPAQRPPARPPVSP